MDNKGGGGITRGTYICNCSNGVGPILATIENRIVQLLDCIWFVQNAEQGFVCAYVCVYRCMYRGECVCVYVIDCLMRPKLRTGHNYTIAWWWHFNWLMRLSLSRLFRKPDRDRNGKANREREREREVDWDWCDDAWTCWCDNSFNC